MVVELTNLSDENDTYHREQEAERMLRSWYKSVAGMWYDCASQSGCQENFPKVSNFPFLKTFRWVKSTFRGWSTYNYNGEGVFSLQLHWFMNFLNVLASHWERRQQGTVWNMMLWRFILIFIQKLDGSNSYPVKMNNLISSFTTTCVFPNISFKLHRRDSDTVQFVLL